MNDLMQHKFILYYWVKHQTWQKPFWGLNLLYIYLKEVYTVKFDNYMVKYARIFHEA